MSENKTEKATLGGGCFWCLEPIFDDLIGVDWVVPGFAGGSLPNPSYQDVISGASGHAEVVQIGYDPQLISFRQLLEIFFSVHDPTTLDRQGADVGSQYRSIILTHDEDQKRVAEDVIIELEREGLWSRSIVTQIEPLQDFYEAEEYHHRYYARNPAQGYCRAVIAPKVAKFRKRFEELRKSSQPA
ncbi:MAG: peptide-methionine (S)-S-oxide reductase MsrA [Chloroflexi bacterium]|nr:peptide-methionine (S)-S-oxide reductase MsrA [Chloroflexota bacterium]